MNAVTGAGMRFVRGLRVWSVKARLARKLAFGLAAAAVVSGLATVVAMTGTKSDLQTLKDLLRLDAVLLLLLGAVISYRLVRLWQERRKGLAGSALHVRLVVLFGLVAVTSPVLVAVFSAVFLHVGLQSWFSERVQTSLERSHVVARAYLHEHRQNIRAGVLAIANDLNREAPTLMRNRRLLTQVLSAQASIRSMSEALIVDGGGRVIARSAFSLSLEFDLVSQDVVDKARKGEVVVLTSEQDDRVRAVVRLDRFVDAYLLVGRFVDSRVLEHIQRVESAVSQYQNMERQREGFQLTFVMMYVLVALLLVLAAMWMGLTLADQLVSPIRGLISAAERIRKGDLSARVPDIGRPGELAVLSRAFNRMTSQIESQQQGLIEANRELDERRRFTETVLSGVSAGVIGLDSSSRIHLPNRSASELLGIDLAGAIGRRLGAEVPEMAGLVTKVMTPPHRPQRAEVRLERDGRLRTLLVRMAAERLGGDTAGYVVTFDDVTELLAAQRQAAWADVARRIAHEIKNPLTPIQLAAERLKRKYMKEVTTDPDAFVTCTDTIVRQVEEIGRMVDEFSSFARMPQPSIKDENFSDICRQTLFLERNRHPDIRFELDLTGADVFVRCDNRQVSRALTNVLKNGAEAVLARGDGSAAATPIGEVQLILRESDEEAGRHVTVTIEDNGAGLPAEDQDRLTEPYVTTRPKGTGLGLAIVKKIVEDHDGDLQLANRPEGGARVVLRFPQRQRAGDKADVVTEAPDRAMTETESLGGS